MEDHGTWLGLAALGISAASMAWNGWLTLENNRLKLESDRLKAEQESNKIRIEHGERRDDKTDGRVDLWVKQNLRRGSVRAVKAEMARPKDPQMKSITITDPEVREAYQPLVPYLKEIRHRYPDEVAFTEKVLEERGDWIIKHICEPLNIGEYECIAMAVSVSEEATKEHRIAPLPPPA